MEYTEWFRTAETDRLAVATLLTAPDQLWSIITFHAQLAAEKYLKGYLAFRRQEPEKIHNLVALLEKAMKFDMSLNRLINDCEHLSYFSVEARYPENEESYTEAVALDAIAASDRICTAIQERIK